MSPRLRPWITSLVAALLAGLASKLAVLAIVRVLLLVFPDEAARQLLLVLGILGVIVGELAAWQARDITRMLAWSSVGPGRGVSDVAAGMLMGTEPPGRGRAGGGAAADPSKHGP